MGKGEETPGDHRALPFLKQTQRQENNASSGFDLHHIEEHGVTFSQFLHTFVTSFCPSSAFFPSLTPLSLWKGTEGYKCETTHAVSMFAGIIRDNVGQ